MDSSSETPVQVPEHTSEVSFTPETQSIESDTYSYSISRKRPCRPPSSVWSHFTRIEDSSEKSSRCKCNYCGRDYACDTKTCGTSTLLNHIKHKCPKSPFREQDKKQKVLSIKKSSDSPSGSSLTVVEFNKEACRKACAMMIIIDELPFRIIEGEGFRHFVSVPQPKFDPPSRITVARDIFQLFLDEKKSVRSSLKQNAQRVCLTTDCWTSLQNINYMCLTCHYVDCDWTLQKRILNFCQVPNHKGETIGKVIESCLIDWGIDKILTITVDNASSNDTTIGYLRRKINGWKGSILEGELLHMRCCAHIINLIVKEGLKDLHDSIASIRNAVRFVRSSPSRLLKFKACVEHEKIEYKGLLILDVCTRWNSTYLMLESALQFQKAFDRLDEEYKQYGDYFLEVEGGKKRVGPPKYEDWENALTFMRFLRTFYNVTLKFSASKYVTSNSYYHEICELQSSLIELSKSGDPLLGKMAASMKDKYDKYWGNVQNINCLLFIATVLDPRYKLEYVKYCLCQVYDQTTADLLIAKIEITLQRLFQQYSAFDSVSSETQSCDKFESSEFDVDGTPKKLMVDSCQRTPLLSKFLKHRQAQYCIGVKTEIEKYLEEPSEDPFIEGFDILCWWKVNSSKYKILSQIARDVLAVPVSTVASESAFSTGGRILDAFRSSLSPKMVEALICSQNWLRSNHESIQIRDYIDEVQAYEQVESEMLSGGSCITTDYITID